MTLAEIDSRAQLIDFIRAHYWPWRCQSKGWIERYLDYIQELDTMEIIPQSSGEGIAGLIIVRFLRRVADAETPYYHSPTGGICWIDLMVAPTAELISALFNAVVKRFGRREPIMWWREAKPGGTDKFAIYTYEQLLEIHRRLIYGRQGVPVRQSP
jgi:hypothetical protein